MSLLRVSHRRQLREADCLVACAAMVLDYLKVRFRYGRLGALLHTTAHGSVFSYLSNLESLGVHVIVEESNLDSLRRRLDMGLPVITAVETGELRSYWSEASGHAVVVVGIDNELVYVNGPEFDVAPQPVPINEFILAWQEQDFRCAVIQPRSP